MYNPARFKASDQEEAFNLMIRYPFATVITVVDGENVISHLPLIATRAENSSATANDEIILIGHLARANPHWNYFKDHRTTIIFQGAHSYITPKWYAKNNVPTWNYSVVHVKGIFELIEDYEGTVKCLKTLSDQVERNWPSGWELYLPEDLVGDQLLRGIVGFKFKVVEINFKRKLHQGASPADRAGVLLGLADRKDDQSHEVLFDMQKLYSSDGEFKK